MASDKRVIFFDFNVPTKYGGPQWRMTFNASADKSGIHQPFAINTLKIPGVNSTDDWEQLSDDDLDAPLDKWYCKLPGQVDVAGFPKLNKASQFKFVTVDKG